MKFARYTTLNLMLIAVFMAAVPLPSYAQQNSRFDRTRMNRDLNIMEGILEKLYSSDQSNNHFIMGNQVSGSYLPGYGVMFRVPSDLFNSPLRSFRMMQVREQLKQEQGALKQEQEHLRQQQDQLRKQEDKLKKKGKQGNLPVMPNQIITPTDALPIAISRDTANSGLSKKEIIDRGITFLSDYAGAIGQLSPSDHIMVQIDRNRDSDFYRPFMERIIIPGSNTSTVNSDKDIYISVPKSDITALRTGKLSNKAFRNRITISDGSINDRQARQFNIMANILSAAFNDHRMNQFHTSGSVDYSYIPDYGVIYYLNAGYFGPISNMVYSISASDDVTSGNGKTGKRNANGKNSVDTIKKAYEAFLADVRETIVDYGPTLRVLKPAQQLMLSIDINNSSNGIPGRVTFQVSRKTLADYSAQRITRSQAMNDIRVTEYD